MSPLVDMSEVYADAFAASRFAAIAELGFEGAIERDAIHGRREGGDTGVGREATRA